MLQSKFEVLSNRNLAPNVYALKLRGDTSGVTAPGQFVQIELPGFFLRRPISVCDAEGDVLTLIYKVVGRGTEAMSALAPGGKLDLLTGLGNGYDLTLCGSAPLLIGGGAGVGGIHIFRIDRGLVRHDSQDQPAAPGAQGLVDGVQPPRTGGGS